MAVKLLIVLGIAAVVVAAAVLPGMVHARQRKKDQDKKRDANK